MQEMGLDEDSPDPIGDAVLTVAGSLAEAKRMLIEKAEEMGFDIMAAANSPEIAEIIDRQRDAVYGQDAFKLSYDYALNARHTLQKADEWVEDPLDPLTREMLAILNQYLFTISAKVHSGFHATLDVDGYEDPEQFADPQSPANGLIKVALIKIERSLLAWTYLLNNSNSAVIRPWIDKLERAKMLLETKFPNARQFVRPGFDEIETVM